MTKAPKSADAPAPASTQQARSTGNGEADVGEVEGASLEQAGIAATPPHQAVPDAACADQVRAFLADWSADRPAEAASGSYGATVRDRWAEQSFEAIPDGNVLAGGWAFTFRESRFIGAAALDQLPPVFVPTGHTVPMTASA